MSTLVPPKPRSLTAKRNFAIVASKFNPEFVQGLVNHATNELRAQAVGANLALYQVPGAFEIPVVVRELALQKRADAILAIGLILKGQTDHAELLARSVTESLQRIMLDYGVPVIHCVLSLENESRARERCLEDKINRGTEAARAAISIANVMLELRGRLPVP
ncbi:MAG: 6,7-dimethyl-8-ribityllumazine synthase [Chthoniobacterales bacterium]